MILAAGSNGKAGRERRVVVTGQGIVSCLGHDVDTFYNNLLAVRQSTELFSLLTQAVLPCSFYAANIGH